MYNVSSPQPEVAQQCAQNLLSTVAIGTVVTVTDQPGSGGAHHHYRISACDAYGEPIGPLGQFARVQFQDGPIKEAGINGTTHEDLLGIVMHRLNSFQSGQFACFENGKALAAVEEAMFWLNKRTADRQARNVEGTHTV